MPGRQAGRVLLSGPADRLPLAVTCATRHVNLVLVIIAVVLGPKAMAMVCAYLTTSQF